MRLPVAAMQLSDSQMRAVKQRFYRFGLHLI